MAPNLLPMVMTPLMAFLVWRRARRHFGRQPIRPRPMQARVVIFAVLGVALVAAGLHDPRLLEGLFGGVLAGAALGVLGLRLTRFEQGPDGADSYVPNPWIGSLLIALLVGRLIWRLLVLVPGKGEGAPAFGNSPLTLLVLGLTIGYYLVYYLGVLAHHRRLLQQRGQG